MQLAAGAQLVLKRTLDFVDLSTRKHDPGPHRLRLVVNGERLNDCEFALVEERRGP